MFKEKTGIAASIAAGMLIAFSGVTATAQQTTTSQSGSSNQQSSTSTQQSGSTSQQSQTNTPQNQSSTSSTQSGTAGQQSGTMSQGQGMTRSSSDSAAAAGISKDDQKFMMAAAEGGMGEVEMAKVALEKASSDSVKQYAQKMIDDHTKANDKLKEIASKKGVTLPTAPDAKRQRTMEKLQQLSGAEFDKAYIREAGNKDHSNQAKLFQKQADRGKDAEVKAFAAETLPTVQMHLQMARDMSAQMGGGSMNMSGSTGGSMSGGSTNRSSGSTNQSSSGSGSQSTTTPSSTTTTTPSTTTPSTTTPSTTTPKR